MQTNAIAFIGLGSMGAPMAGNLLAGGVPLTVFNRPKARAQPLTAAGAKLADTPAATVVSGGVVVTMVANDAALEEVALGHDGFVDRLGKDGLHISMSTVRPRRRAGSPMWTTRPRW